MVRRRTRRSERNPGAGWILDNQAHLTNSGLGSLREDSPPEITLASILSSRRQRETASKVSTSLVSGNFMLGLSQRPQKNHSRESLLSFTARSQRGGGQIKSKGQSEKWKRETKEKPSRRLGRLGCVERVRPLERGASRKGICRVK